MDFFRHFLFFLRGIITDLTITVFFKISTFVGIVVMYLLNVVEHYICSECLVS